MIVYDLSCDSGHRFEGWFGSSEDYAEQRDDGLVTCPQCGSPHVSKAPMAPAVGKKGNQRSQPVSAAPAAEERQQLATGEMPAEVAQALKKLAEAQAKALKHSKWVGSKFAEQTRAMHYGERDHEAIHGEASIEEAEELFDEGLAIAPIVVPIAPPDEIN